MHKIFLPLFLLLSTIASAQVKKPIDHSVYDNWKSAGERTISNDGKYVLYTINAQEGDGELVIKNLTSNYKLTVPRGYNAVITEDSRYAVFKIKPAYQDTRQAKIKKKKADEMPKDSLVIVQLGADSMMRVARIKSYKTPKKGFGWVAYHMEKALPDSAKKKLSPDSLKTRIDMLTKLADSVIRKSIDSVKGKIEKEEVIVAAQKAVKEIYKKADDLLLEQSLTDAEGDDAPGGAATEGTDLVIRELSGSKSKTFPRVSEYLFDEKGTKLLMEITKNPKDSNSKALVLIYELATSKTDTVMKGFNDAKNFVFDRSGNQIGFVAERDSSTKALQKFYKLWYYSNGKDSAIVLSDKNTPGMQLGYTVSENAWMDFSRDGNKLFFGVSAIQPAKDTNLVDFELARLDVWHYNDDYLQPQQLKQLAQEQRRSYVSVINIGQPGMIQVGAFDAENVSTVNEGNADWALAQSTRGNRVASQWEGRQKYSGYVVNTSNGQRKSILANNIGFFQASPNGKFVYWYNPEKKDYFTYNIATGITKNITEKIKEPLYDTENDVPDFPSPAGTIGWTADDKYFLIKDEFDIWQVDPAGLELPKNITNGYGKKNKTEFNYVRLDQEKRFINSDETILLQSLNKVNKYGGYFTKKVNEVADPTEIVTGPNSYLNTLKAENAEVFFLQKTSIASSELYAGTDLRNPAKLTDIASQQDAYNWLTAELVRWKMFDGKMSEGILYKPQNFDPKKKYPVIFYFYERNTDGLFSYKAPAPSASTVNIPYFVSNEYIVFDPNIYYKTGEPGQSAYNSVVSAAKFLAKMPFIDSTRMAIQGQSWGGYQVAYLITRTNMFRAAGAGAPVANMTSAYGGIRWGTGLNRQFQYEKTQSRIGATLWQRQDLYIKNSPLFFADKVKTPLLLMHNDADGSVPWYQGIEYFTALRRLNKKVWMLEYNGEDHNLVERKNRKDLSVRLAQFFDYYLKDAKPARWITEGVPATEKGRDWGLEIP
jgi:dipeptidyl aminopeptidase/acylaminoacyl peptidase